MSLMSSSWLLFSVESVPKLPDFFLRYVRECASVTAVAIDHEAQERRRVPMIFNRRIIGCNASFRKFSKDAEAANPALFDIQSGGSAK